MESRTDIFAKAAESLRSLAELMDEIGGILCKYDVEAVLKNAPVAQASLFDDDSGKCGEKTEEEEEEETPEPTFADVQKALADKARNGFRQEVHVLLAKYGAVKLSDIKPERYASLLKDADEYCRDISRNEIVMAAQWILANRMEDDLKELLLYHGATSVDDLPKSHYAGFLFDARRM